MDLVSTFLLVAATWATSPAPACQEPHAPRPNILLIVSDDAGWADFGFHGSDAGLTPQLDALAAQGVVCTQAYVSASVCCPSRAGLMTGRYQQRFGHEFNGPGRPEPGYTQSQMGLSREERTLAELLKARGYRTAAVGKWHLGAEPGLTPRERGFDHWYGFLAGSRSYRPTENPNRMRQLQHDDQVVPESEIDYLTDTLADYTAQWVADQAQKEQPWFVYLAFNAPHTPMQARDDDLERFASIENRRRRTYAAMLYAMDRAIGRIVTSLEASGQRERTLIIFVNDNGGATNNGSDNGPWRGRKGSKWEGGLRVPMLWSWPGGLPEGRRHDAVVSSLDIAPTVLAAAGAPLPTASESMPAGPFDGVDQTHALQGESATEPRPLYWRRGVAAALRDGPWKLVRVDTLPAQLIHLEQASDELTNFAAEHPERVRKMLAALVAWESELAPPRWTEGPRWARNQLRKHSPEVDTREEEEEVP